MNIDAARRAVIVPGYGMAVSQAQHAVRDLANLLASRGVEVEFAIHPVAGRMPGHMNVLLAEADVAYDKLKEMDQINFRIDILTERASQHYRTSLKKFEQLDEKLMNDPRLKALRKHK